MYLYFLIENITAAYMIFGAKMFSSIFFPGETVFDRKIFQPKRFPPKNVSTDKKFGRKLFFPKKMQNLLRYQAWKVI